MTIAVDDARKIIERTREILAGIDIGSLPNDYPLERMAADRMKQIEDLEKQLEKARP